MADRKAQWQTISTALSTATFFREKVHQTSGEKIPHAQAKQQRDHNRHHQVSKNLKLGQNVLLENQIREDKKAVFFHSNGLVLTQSMLPQRGTFTL